MFVLIRKTVPLRPQWPHPASAAGCASEPFELVQFSQQLHSVTQTHGWADCGLVSSLVAGLREIESQNFRAGRHLKDYLDALPILLMAKLRPRDAVLLKETQVSKRDMTMEGAVKLFQVSAIDKLQDRKPLTF